jgi:hypothetical protein
MNSFLDKLNLKPQERRLVVIVAIVIFIGLNIWFVFPVFGELGRAQERIRYQRKLLSDFQDEVNKKPAYEKELSQLKSKGLYIPSEEVAGQLMREVQDQARASLVNLIRYDASKKSSFNTNAFFDEQSLVVSLGSTGERELIDFLYRLSARESLTRVRSMNLSPDPPRQKLNGSITLVRSYQRKPPARSAASAAPASRPPTVTTPTNAPTATLSNTPAPAVGPRPSPAPAMGPPPSPAPPAGAPSTNAPPRPRELPKRILPKPTSPQ